MNLPLLSKQDILKWLDRIVGKSCGDNLVALSFRGREIPPVEVARLAHISYRMLKYLARGERKLSDRLQRVLSNVIRSIESGEVVFTPGRIIRTAIEVENPKPRMTMAVKINSSGVSLEIAKPMHGPTKMPTFPDVFKRR